MYDMKISDSVVYIGVDDKDIDLFESQYKVPNGVTYNSYVILDEKIAVMDTVDKRRTQQWLDNLEKVLEGREPDYLVVSHLEPDHASNIQLLAEKYPNMQVVSNAKVFSMLPQFFTLDFAPRSVVVKEGDTLSLGNHTLQFFMAPMVHWPEVMVEYEQTEKILIRQPGSGPSEESRYSGYPDNLPSSRTCSERKPGILYRQVSHLEQLRTGRRRRSSSICVYSRKYRKSCSQNGRNP